MTLIPTPELPKSAKATGVPRLIHLSADKHGVTGLTPKSTRLQKLKVGYHYDKMLSYRRETALQDALQFSPKVEDWNWETIFYKHYRSIFNHNRPENLSNSVKKNAK